jgi:hypothetical protein
MMRTYLKILGLLSLVIVIIALILVFAYAIDIEDVTVLVLLIPLYFIFHYLLLTKFGFTADLKVQSKLFSVIIILGFVIFLCLPLVYVSKDISDRKKIETLKEPITLTDTTIYSIECNIKTRFDGENLDYIFKSKFLNENTPRINTYHVNFIDNDGFVVFSMQLDKWTSSMDEKNEKLLGCTTSGKKKLESKEYSRIRDIDIAISKEN